MSAMPALRDWQSSFSTALRGGPVDTVAATIHAGGIASAQRVQIYQHAVAAILEEALATAFPVVRALLGEACFSAAAEAFKHEHPPQHGNLQVYGQGFADFLGEWSVVVELAYLPDVAAIEWARQGALLAADEAAIPASALATAVETGAVLRLHPSVQFLDLATHALDIWRWCQNPEADNPQIADGPQSVLVWRSGSEIACVELDSAGARLVTMIAAGKPLNAAIAAAVEGADEQAATQALGQLVRERLLIHPRGDLP